MADNSNSGALSSECTRNDSVLTDHHPESTIQHTTPRQPENEFRHMALIVRWQEFRLLQVLPSLSESGLLCSRIHHFRLDAPELPSFEALSYVWGKERPYKTILVNDALFSVRLNLWNFLDVSRRQRANTWLFVDAICIDQTNLQERARQVQLMGEIYTSAKQVLIWLGSEDKDIASLMILARNGKLAAGAKAIATFRKNEGTMVWSSVRYTIGSNSGSIDFQQVKTIESGAVAIVSHAYWRRIWIIQEVLLAQDRKILYDEFQLSWADYLALLDLPCTWSSDGRRFLNYSNRISRSQDRPSVRNFNIVDLMQYFDHTQCSIPHDHVYGLLALSKDSQALPVDYNSGIVDLAIATLSLGLVDGNSWGPRMFSVLQLVSNTLAHNLRILPLRNPKAAKEVALPFFNEAMTYRMDIQD